MKSFNFGICLVLFLRFGISAAFAEDDIKRAIYSDCANARIIAGTLTPDQKHSFSSFLNNLLKAKESLGARSNNIPPPGTPNRIGIAALDEPKIGELVAINNAERDQTAKECALAILPLLLPESLKVIPTLFTLEHDISNPEFLRVGAPRTSSLMALRVTDETQILSLIDLSVRELELHQVASAQNILFELFTRKKDFIIDRLIISSLSEYAIAQLILHASASQTDSLILAQHFIKEGGKKRGVGVALLSSLPELSLLHPEIVRVVFESLNISEFKTLQIGILKLLSQTSTSEAVEKQQDIASAIIGTELRISLKGADDIDKKNIAVIGASLSTIPADLEAEILPIIKANQPELIDSLVAIAPKSAASKKIRDDFLKIIKDPSREDWAKIFIAFDRLSPKDTDSIDVFLGLLIKDIRAEYRSLIEERIVSLFADLNPVDHKKKISDLKTISKKKGITTAQKISFNKILSTISPTSITASQLVEVITSGSCSVLKDDALILKSKVSSAQFFSRLIGCMQIAASSAEDVTSLLQREIFTAEARREFVIQAISNQLYDRRFRAELSTIAAKLSIQIDSILSSVILLAADPDEMVWRKALDGLSLYQKSASPYIAELMKVQNSSNAFKLKQSLTALSIHSESSSVSIDSLNTSLLEALEVQGLRYIDEITSLNEGQLNSLLVKIIEDFPVELRPKALNFITKSTFHLNQPLEDAITSQIASKVQSVSDAAVLAAFVRGIDVPILRQHLREIIFSTARDSVFSLPLSVNIRGRAILESLFSEAPEDRQSATYRVFESQVRAH
jgi:hypothetical protein